MFGPVVDVILPIFGLLMIGYITVMLGWFDQTAIKGLTRFVFDFAVPMLLLRLKKQVFPTKMKSAKLVKNIVILFLALVVVVHLIKSLSNSEEDYLQLML